MIDEASHRSRELLARCRTPAGFVASADLDHYHAVWARDACITSLGALATRDPDLVSGVTDTLDTLAASTSELGRVPAVVSTDRTRWDWAEGGTVDCTAWFVILCGQHLATTHDLDRARGWWPTVQRAMSWLAHQDADGSGLISAAPATDWMDAALTRSGRTLHLNVLYAWAAEEAASLAAAVGEAPPADADDLRRRVDTWFWPDPRQDVTALYPHGFHHAALRIAYWQAGSYPRRHYASHIVHAAIVDHCDVLANLLAVLTGVAPRERAETILDHLAEQGFDHPTPSMVEPVQPGDPSGMLISAAEAVIPEPWRNRPGRYHNGATWPYIGGFHVAALARAGRRAEAADTLERLAGVNALGEWSFPEWVADGAVGGARLQAWNAGAFLLGEAALAPR